MLAGQFDQSLGILSEFNTLDGFQRCRYPPLYIRKGQANGLGSQINADQTRMTGQACVQLVKCEKIGAHGRAIA